jgi:hypothetical protein
MEIQKETAKEIKQSVSTKGDTNVTENIFITAPKPSPNDRLFNNGK